MEVHRSSVCCQKTVEFLAKHYNVLCDFEINKVDRSDKKRMLEIILLCMAKEIRKATRRSLGSEEIG